MRPGPAQHYQMLISADLVQNGSDGFCFLLVQTFLHGKPLVKNTFKLRIATVNIFGARLKVLKYIYLPAFRKSVEILFCCSLSVRPSVSASKSDQYW
jgi:hypothetical protein